MSEIAKKAELDVREFGRSLAAAAELASNAFRDFALALEPHSETIDKLRRPWRYSGDHGDFVEHSPNNPRHS